MMRTATLMAMLGASQAFAAVTEGQSFTLNQAGTVFYGAGSALVRKDLPAGTHRCGNLLFGDPANGKVKACYLPINEGQSFSVTKQAAVLYGSGSRFVTKTVPPGTHTCGNALLGDPAPGLKKQCTSTGHLDTIDCYPSQLSGTGSRAAWGASLSPLQAWAGWWCGQSVQIVACAGDGCLPVVAKRVISTTSNTINAELRGARTEHIDSDRLKAVWGPHWSEIEAAR